jgi:hypothetical protein
VTKGKEMSVNIHAALGPWSRWRPLLLRKWRGSEHSHLYTNAQTAVDTSCVLHCAAKATTAAILLSTKVLTNK